MSQSGHAGRIDVSLLSGDIGHHKLTPPCRVSAPDPLFEINALIGVSDLIKQLFISPHGERHALHNPHSRRRYSPKNRPGIFGSFDRDGGDLPLDSRLRVPIAVSAT
jgi:hypothetical protein